MENSRIGKEWNGERNRVAEYAILRFAKHKAGPAGALEAHHERTKEQYASNPDIDTARSKDNFHIVQPGKCYRQEIDTRIKAAGCKTRKDSTMFVDTLITASPEFFEGRKKAEIKAFFTEDGRLSAKEILGNRAQLSKWQEEFHAHMKKQFPILKRGESALVTKRKHIPTWLFKQSVSLIKQKQAIEKTISDITMMNAGKKREEALAMLDKFFPRLEAHLGQVKKYQATIDYLTQENDGLKEKVKDENSVKRQLEAAKLKQENEQLRQFISKIPPEMRREIQQRQTPQKGRVERD